VICVVCGLECVPYTRRLYCSLQCQRRAQYERRLHRMMANCLDCWDTGRRVSDGQPCQSCGRYWQNPARPTSSDGVPSSPGKAPAQEAAA
jgi:hypothetical protein